MTAPDTREGSSPAARSGRSDRAVLFERTARLTAGRLGGAALSAGWLIVAARSLSITAFADLALLLGLNLMLATLADAGQSLILTRDVSIDPACARPAMAMVLRRRGLLGAGVVVLLAALWLPLASDASPLVVAVFGVSVLSTTVYTTLNAAQRGLGRIGFEAWNELCSRALVLVLGSILLAGGGGLTAAVVAYAVADAASAIVAGVVAHRSLPVAASTAPGASLRDSFGLALAGILGNAYNSIDLWLLGLLGSPRAVAVYAASYRVLEGLVLPSIAIGSLAVPALARVATADRAARLLKMVGLALAMVAPLALTAAVAAPWVLRLLFGEDYRSGDASVLVVLAAAALPTAVIGVCGPPALLGARRRVILALAFVVVSITALDLVAIPMAGAIGAAAVTAGCQIVLAGMLLGTALKLLRNHEDI